MTKADRSRLEWLAKHTVSIHMGHSRYWDLSIPELQMERERTEKQAAHIFHVLDRELITFQEAISMFCELAG